MTGEWKPIPPPSRLGASPWQVAGIVALLVLVVGGVAAISYFGRQGGATRTNPTADAGAADLSGKVVFTQPSYSCGTGGTVWRFAAYFNDRAGGLSVQLTIGAKSATGESSAGSVPIEMVSPDIRTFTDGPLDVALFCKAPYGVGTYVVRVIRPSDAHVLATGEFAMER